MEQYFIYHIPNYVNSNGSLGKIGCSNNPDKRVKDQGYDDFEILEVHTDIELASNREQELQRQYGYPVDHCSYSHIRKTSIKGGRAAGLINGKRNVESGHLQRIAHLGGKASGPQSGKWAVESGHLQRISSLGGKAASKITNAKRVTCDICGVFTSTPGAVGNHKKTCPMRQSL